MASPMSPADVLERDFLKTRARVLEVAADFDRLERAGLDPGSVDDERLVQLRRAIDVLIDGQSERASRVQMVFSDKYDSGWKLPTGPRG